MRWLLSAIGVIVSLGCIAAGILMNWKYGMSLGRNPDEQLIYSWVGAGFDALKISTPFFAWWALRNRRWLAALFSSIIMLGCISYSVIGIAGFVEVSRATTTGAVLSKQGDEKNLQADLTRKTDQLGALGIVRPVTVIDHELEGLRQDKRWTTSQECKDATSPASRDFCAGYNARQAEREKAVSAGKLENEIGDLRKSIGNLAGVAQIDRGDPRAGFVSRITGWDLPKVETGLSGLFVFLLESIATFGIFISLNHGELARDVRKLKVAPPPVAPVAVVVDQRPKLKKSDVRAALEAPLAPAENLLTTRPVGDVARYADERLEEREGERVELGMLHADYCAWCQSQDARALSRAEFNAAFDKLAGLVDFKVEGRGRQKFCVHMQLKQAA